MIGSEGGSLVSADGELTLVVPQGAVSQPTQFGIQPLTNECFAGLGSAYRLTPDGATFAKPVELRFKLAEEVAGAGGLGVAFQDADKYWEWLDGVLVDPKARIATLATPHFTDYSRVHGLHIDPDRPSLKVGESTPVRLFGCYFPRDQGDVVSLMHPCLELSGVSADLPGLSIDAASWSVNGFPGTDGVSGDLTELTTSAATYNAPASTPATNPVAVSVKTKTRGELLVANISVGSGYKIGIRFAANGSVLPCMVATSDFTDGASFHLNASDTGFAVSDLVNEATVFTPPMVTGGKIVVDVPPVYDVTKVDASEELALGDKRLIQLTLEMTVASGACTLTPDMSSPVSFPSAQQPPFPMVLNLSFDTSTKPYTVTQDPAFVGTVSVEPL